MTAHDLYVGQLLERFDVWSLLAAFVLISATIGLASIYKTYSVSKKLEIPSDSENKRPESVNYHFTRQCNYQCGFCFHTAKTSFVLPLEEAKRGLRMLTDAG